MSYYLQSQLGSVSSLPGTGKYACRKLVGQYMVYLLCSTRLASHVPYVGNHSEVAHWWLLYSTIV